MVKKTTLRRIKYENNTQSIKYENNTQT